MTQIATVLAVASVFIGFLILIFSFYNLRRWELIRETKLPTV